jgi:HTH-type transcriptional regulator/antitoxin HigA
MPKRIPAEVFPPGEYLADELSERGWTEAVFAARIHRRVEEVREVIAGRRRITREIAEDIAAALGSSPRYWMSLEAAYRMGKAAAVAEPR